MLGWAITEAGPESPKTNSPTSPAARVGPGRLKPLAAFHAASSPPTDRSVISGPIIYSPSDDAQTALYSSSHPARNKRRPKYLHHAFSAIGGNVRSRDSRRLEASQGRVEGWLYRHGIVKGREASPKGGALVFACWWRC